MLSLISPGCFVQNVQNNMQKEKRKRVATQRWHFTLKATGRRKSGYTQLMEIQSNSAFSYIAFRSELILTIHVSIKNNQENQNPVAKIQY